MKPLLAFLFLSTPLALADDLKPEELAKLEKHRCPKPTEFASVFSLGYAGDLMPKEDARFEEMLKVIREAGFNVIHCTYTEQRVELCKKHDIKMMVDLLAEQHHVFKSPEKAQAVCEKLRNNPAIWGYNIWNDPVRKTGEGRRRDVNNVRRWDPTHPAYSGAYRTEGLTHLPNADMIGYYDFHWKRGTGQHFSHLLTFSNWARAHDAYFCAWLSASSGQAGKGNFNRNLYSANTSIACGLKGVLWFLGTDLMDSKSLQWKDAGHDIIKVNREIMPLAKILCHLGNPVAIYSTTITRTLNDTPITLKDAMPPGLEKNGFPKDFWLQPMAGEFVAGIFKDGNKRDAAFLANHNAYAEQKVMLKLGQPRTVELFQRSAAKWQELKVMDGTMSITLAPGGGELLRFSH
jgi:hypothetical protein